MLVNQCSMTSAEKSDVIGIRSEPVPFGSTRVWHLGAPSL